MRGKLVIVRTFNGLPLIRKIWDYNEKMIFIVDDKTFERLSLGDKNSMPVGFPKEDVFEYDPILVKTDFDKKNINWSKLTTWKKN